MEDFILIILSHDATCSVAPKHIKRVTSQDAGITELWRCLVYSEVVLRVAAKSGHLLWRRVDVFLELHLQSMLN
jgi:hypothetical protein